MMASSLENLSPITYQWLYLGAMALAMVLGAIAVFIWVKYVPKRRKRKRRHHGHGRVNPTRAETGGLPPPKPSADAAASRNPGSES